MFSAPGLWQTSLRESATGKEVFRLYSYGEAEAIGAESCKTLQPGLAYRFSYFIDQQLDLNCTSPADLVEQVDIPPVEGAVSLEVTLGEGAPGSCDDHPASATEFHLVVTFDGFLFEEQPPLLYCTLQGAVYKGSAFANMQPLILSGALKQGKSYVFRFFIDRNEDGKCDPQTDRVWSVPIDSVSGHVVLEHQASTSQDPDGCFEPPG